MKAQALPVVYQAHYFIAACKIYIISENYDVYIVAQKFQYVMILSLLLNTFCPPICKQKNLIVHLKLPWGNICGLIMPIVEETNM